MKINYNQWFYEFNNYIHGRRGYNDDSWIDIGKRYKNLINLHSQLMNEQPFGVVGNRTGFDKLINLVTKSNYRFNEIDDALLETYEQSLRSSMGSMLVNTHAVIFHAKDLTDKNISNQNFTSFYVVDVPYDQMHFCERDEFIRQKLGKMHDSVNDQYIPIDEFLSDEFTSILGFSVICTINGLICNDLHIGFDDHGLKFKFRYTGVADAEIIIYKLDNTTVKQFKINASNINNGKIRINLNSDGYNGQHCIVDIYHKDYMQQVQVVPNFGYVEDGILKISQIQKGTYDLIDRFGDDLDVYIYFPKYMNEVKGIYPMANYFNISHVRPIYTDLGNDVRNRDGKAIVGSDELNRYSKLDIPKCTPPICIDREYETNFDDIIKCVNIRSTLSEYESIMTDITNVIEADRIKTYNDYLELMRAPILGIYNNILKLYMSYIKAAYITSVIEDDSLLKKFGNLVNSLSKLCSLNRNEYMNYMDYVDDYVLMPAYSYLIDELADPYDEVKEFEPFRDILDITENFQPDSKFNSYHYNRPVSEQCFISLKWSRDDSSWVFTYPDIKHFRGIENTFYINNAMDNSVFKFFVLYTDTFYPSADVIDDTFTINEVLDYDEFIRQTENHLGFIRYWDVENQLMRLSKLLYNKYDDEHVVHILSDILCHRLDVKDLLNTYWSDIKYSRANITSDNYEDYDEMSDRAPLTINFLFYTMSLLNNDPDQLQAYFYHKLTDEKFDERYMDYNVSSATDDAYKLPYNFSYYYNSSYFSNLISSRNSNPKSDGKRHLYYGAGTIFQNATILDSSAYQFTFHQYNRKDDNGNFIKYPLVTDDGYDDTNYISSNGSLTPISYYYDIKLAKLITRYLTCAYNCISHVETNYHGGYNLTYIVENFIKDLTKIHNQIIDFFDNIPEGAVHHISNEFKEELIDGDGFLSFNGLTLPFSKRLEDIYNRLTYLVIINGSQIFKSNNNSTSVVPISHINLHYIANWFLRNLRKIYFITGYKTRTIQRVRGIYLYFKKFNKIQSVYSFRNLHRFLDSAFISYDLASAASSWDSSVPDKDQPFDSNSELPTLAAAGKAYVRTIKSQLAFFETYYELLEELSSIKSGFLTDLSDYVRKVVNEYTFDLYVIDQIIPKSVNDEDAETVVTFNRKPVYVRWQVARDQNHPQFTPPSNSIPYPSEGLRSLYFGIKFDKTKTGYNMRRYGGIIKTCEYTFFDGTTIDTNDAHSTFEFMDETGNLITSLKCKITFRKVGNTADLTQDIELMLNGCNTTVDIQNVHEDDIITSEEKPEVVQIKKTTNTNYEMLMSNRYTQLDHFYEKIATFKNNVQGPVDRIYMNNQGINQFVLSDLGDKPTSQLFFKPVQIMHGSNTPVGRGLTVGQKIYLMTNDDLHYVFPAYVTTGTHTRTKGFVEAEVDSRHAKWFEIKDKTLIEKYLNEEIECTILDDNYSNFYDEFNNSEYSSYTNPIYDPDLEYEDEDYNELYSTLGDPVYVQNNANYIYTRLNHFLNPLVDNRFIDEEHKLYRFIFLGGYDMVWLTSSNVAGIVIKMVSRDMNSLTKPEMYPILRDEPNDHDVKLIEYYTFKRTIDDIENEDLDRVIDRIDTLYERLRFEDLSPYEVKKIYSELDSLFIKEAMYDQTIKRITDYMEDPEKPTRWFNVPSYEDSEMYINSNRTNLPKTFKVNVADLLCYEGCEVWLYDWEHKHWIDPSTYTVYRNHVNDGNLDVEGEYIETDVLMSLGIFPKAGSNFEQSKKVLVYIGYKSSNIYDNIQPLTTVCDVKFKPILSSDNTVPDDPDALNKDAYNKLKIRKNIDLYESYVFKSVGGQIQYNTPSDFKDGDAFYIKRPTYHNGSNLYIHPTFNDFSTNLGSYDIYTRLQLNDVSTDRALQEQVYNSNVVQEIDNFVVGEKVKLICINSSQADYNGNISTVMFEGITGLSGENNSQTITITNSSLPDLKYGNFLCTVFHDVKYKSTGGIIRVTVISNYETVVDTGGSWVRIPSRYLPYQEIPDEFVVYPINPATPYARFEINLSYKKKIDDIIYKNSSGVNNPFEFYYDYKNKLRYPISNTRRNKYDERLTYVNPTTADMDGIQVVKTNHLHVCRYSLAHIPVNGIIDVTGYVPTPLSRRRYEWWVNGKQLLGNDNLIITSPTSFQLINLRSLKNFELVELVDDMYDSIMTNLSNVYVDLEGNVYTSYQEAFKSNKDVVYQSINFSFNGYPNHNQYQNDTSAFVRNPNNIDIEDDIMDKWIDTTETESNDYNDLYNVPTLNGVEIYHPFSDDLGLREIPNIEVLDQLDKTWKLERTTDKFFPVTHYDDSMIEDDQYLLFHIKETNESFVIYITGTYRKYFTLYLSKGQYSSIESATNTIKVIPFVRTGVRIELDKSIRGLWLHATNGNYIPKKIQ